MRGAASLSTIQQTLTPEAAGVLKQSVADAARRCHGQTTPLHVAAALLGCPTGFLRHACVLSHPLQCRALDLCFSVALDRLPAAAPPSEPPLSNALTAALKRAQAHQRRGCPEQQQQPLLAVKVELEQLVVSILDDPSVSRIMREAGFSSPAVKAAVEQSLFTTSSSSPMSSGRSRYLNPRLQDPNSGRHIGGDDVKKVFEILSRSRKRNPILVGESEPEIVISEVLRRIESRELGIAGTPLTNAEVVSVEKELGLAKLKDLGGFIFRRMMMCKSGGLIVDLGDLKWGVDQPPCFGASDDTREAVAEIGKVLARFNGSDEGCRVWVIATATCETYLRCQVYYPTMESEWDLQPLSIVARAPLPSTFLRIGTNGIRGSSSESFNPLKSLSKPTLQPSAWTDRNSTQNVNPFGKHTCCSQCMQEYEQELSKLSAQQPDKPASDANLQATQKQLPKWLQNATVHDIGNKSISTSYQTKDQDLLLKQKSEELKKKWSNRCLLLHPSFHQNGSLGRRMPTTPLSLTSLYANPNLLARQPVTPKTHQPNKLGDDLSLNMNSNSLGVEAHPVHRLQIPPGSPVRTDLVLGQTKTQEACDKHIDADSFKILLKGLMEKVWWQRDAARAVATVVTRCKLGSGGQRSGGAKGDIWLLFSGPDRTGKKKMAAALSELVCGTGPVILSLGSRRDVEESCMNFRGKTVLDQIAEAIRRNPFSVIMLQDVDEADTLVRGSIKRAMERSRFTDSYGREIILGNIVFVLTVNKRAHGQLDEEKLVSMPSGGWQLKISVDSPKSGKRHPNWLADEEIERGSKQRRAFVSFDLNEIAADTTQEEDDNRLEKSHNSSDLTVEHHDQEEKGHDNNTTSAFGDHRLFDSVDECVVFKNVEFGLMRKNVERTITGRFRTVFGEKVSIRVESDALDRILGGSWLGSSISLDSWVEKVLAPAIHQLKLRLNDLPMVARLELDDDGKSSKDQRNGDWLPSSIN